MVRCPKWTWFGGKITFRNIFNLNFLLLDFSDSWTILSASKKVNLLISDVIYCGLWSECFIYFGYLYKLEENIVKLSLHFQAILTIAQQTLSASERQPLLVPARVLTRNKYPSGNRRQSGTLIAAPLRGPYCRVACVLLH